MLDEVLVLVMDAAIDATGAERGFIMLANREGELEFTIAPRAASVTLSGQSFATSQKIPQQVFSTGREQIVADLREGGYGRRASRHRGARHSATCCARRCGSSGTGRDRPPTPIIGRLASCISTAAKRAPAVAGARSALESVATEAASAIESARLYREATEKARMERELQLAAEIQRALLPERCCRVRTSTWRAPRSRAERSAETSSTISTSRAAFGFALGDVAGKGPPAALLTAMIQGVVLRAGGRPTRRRS